MSEILLVTLGMDSASFAHFDALRRAHFPPARNKIPAHITLFHALPGGERAAIETVLADHAASTRPFAMLVDGLMFLGAGVAYTIASPEARELHAALKTVWFDWLNTQDRRQSYRPHITVQNKTTPEAARDLHTELQHDFQPRTITATGFDLWFYRGGPWEHAAFFLFTP